MKKNYFIHSKAVTCLTLLSLFFLLLGVKESNASHLAGGNFTYTHISGNTYRIRATIYRDCQGINAPTTVTVNYVNTCTNQSYSITANKTPTSPILVNPPCPGQLTRCNGGTNPGIQRWDYDTVVTLPAQCADWRFSFTQNARNSAITTIVNPGSNDMYIEAHLNNLNDSNNSVKFSIDPILFICTNQNFCFNNGATDADGDSLVYSLIAPLTAANTPVVYKNANYDALHPITSNPPVTIDPSTGDVCMHPTAAGEVGVMAMLIKEYRNGVLMGQVLRDIQIYTQVCTNNLPSLSGINNTTDFSTSICAGGTICFDIFSTDANANDTLKVTANNTFGTFTTIGSIPRPTGHFCWTTTTADIGTTRSFLATVKDNACPTPGTQIYTYSITVNGMQATATSTNVNCNGGKNGTATVTVTAGNGPFQYLWTPGQYVGQTVNNLSAGTYTVVVAAPGNCNISQTVVITQPPALLISSTLLDPATCLHGGSFDVAANGGTPTYLYSTNTSPAQTSTQITNAAPGTYTTTVRDSKGCRSSVKTVIAAPPAVVLSTSSTPDVCSASNGTATVSASGGQGPFTYAWSPVGGNGATASNLAAGAYSVLVTDANGCTSSQSVTVNPDNTNCCAMTIALSSTPETCVNQKDGMAGVAVSGGTAPFTYAWSPSGGNGAVASGLSTGTYTLTVTDANGCTDTQSITVGFNRTNCCD